MQTCQQKAASALMSGISRGTASLPQGPYFVMTVCIIRVSISSTASACTMQNGLHVLHAGGMRSQSADELHPMSRVEGTPMEQSAVD